MAARWTLRLAAHKMRDAGGGAPAHNEPSALLPPGDKLIHFVRHAQGFHNIDSRPIHEREPDARLTPEGEAQCAALAADVTHLTPELVVASPLTRTLQTATLVFGAHLRGSSPPPLIACEHARETVNYLCDCRR
jgi:phosphohistidine phosphatase SixA